MPGEKAIMPGLVAGIKCSLREQNVDGRGNVGHDKYPQCDRARQKATTCSSAVFIGEAGNSASASTAIAP